MHLPSNAARVAMFADSLHAKHIGVATVQEGRSKQSGILSKHGYKVFSSGSVHGQLGTQIWVHPEVSPFCPLPP
eukprot:5551116-Prorocentrum_lima.AAC.1